MAHLSLTFLGVFQALLGSKSLTAFRSSRVQALLVYLALTPQQAHSREVLVTLFWPDEPDNAAKQNLRQSLYQLRQLLHDTDSQEETHLLVTRSTVQFNPASDHSLDVADFLTYLENAQLEQAAALYQGDLLPGFTCDSLPFEAWLRQERERLHRLALDALFELAAQSLVRGDYRAAQNFAEQQLALEPWREEAHRQLIQALALLGERSAALVQYETCQAVLKAELDAEPSAETEAMIAHIRDQQSQWDRRQAAVGSFERRRLTTPFVGREVEFDVLSSAYQQAFQDGIRVVALVGEAGIGKTRLAEYFLDWAATQGADILRGRAFETSERLSYQPLTSALRPRLERENAPEDLLSDLWLAQMTRILPELRDRYPDLPPPTQEESTGRQHLFEAITRLVQALADRAPLILFLDDWHWADAISMDVLHYAAQRWLEEGVPILVLLTLRQESLAESPGMQTWLNRLKRHVAYTQVALAALSGTETEHLLRILIVPVQEENDTPDDIGESPPLTTFSRWLFEETDGQPIFLVETLKAMIEEGLIQPDADSQAWRVDWAKFDALAAESSSYLPTGVREIIRNWLERITKPATELLLAAAVLGQQASFDHLCCVAGLEELRAVAALDELLVKQLLVEADEKPSGPGYEPAYSFSHQMLSEVLYAEAGAARRRLLHRRAFEAWQAIASASELAYHALHAGLVAETVEYSVVAGNDAMRLFAPRVAIVHYGTAWQLMAQAGWPEAISGADKQDLYTGLGRAYELIESWSQALDIYQAMIADARTIGAPTMECLGLNRLATVYINGLRDPRQASTRLEEARKVAERSGNRRGLAETELISSAAARVEQKTDLARHHGEQALAIARELGHPQLLARCLNSLSYVHSHLRHWEMVKTLAQDASDLCTASGNRILEADSQRMIGWSELYCGRPHESLRTLRETLAFSQQIENLWGQAECAWRMALALLELGRYGEAIRFAQQAIEQAPLVGQPRIATMALSAWGTVQRTVMALEAAEKTLSDTLAETTEKGLSGLEDWMLAELCAVYALGDDWDRAYRSAKQLTQLPGHASLPPIALIDWYEIEALLRGGDDDLARAAVERLGKMVGNNRRYRLLLLRSRAVLAQWDGDTGQAIQHLRAAAALAQEMDLPGEEWSILAALGALYTDQREQNEAQRAWKMSADIIVRLANTIDEEDLRVGFLDAEVIRHILARQ